MHGVHHFGLVTISGQGWTLFHPGPGPTRTAFVVSKKKRTAFVAELCSRDRSSTVPMKVFGQNLDHHRSGFDMSIWPNFASVRTKEVASFDSCQML